MLMSYYVKDLKNWCKALYEDSYEMFENSERWGLIVNSMLGVVMIVDVLKGKSWAAKCCPEDTFNMYIGYAIAYCRMRNIPMPEEKKLVKLSDLDTNDEFIYNGSKRRVLGFNKALTECVVRDWGQGGVFFMSSNVDVEKVED